jgi:hypothetical protein
MLSMRIYKCLMKHLCKCKILHTVSNFTVKRNEELRTRVCTEKKRLFKVRSQIFVYKPEVVVIELILCHVGECFLKQL